MDVLSRVLRGRPDSVVVKPAPKVVLSLLPAFGYNPANGFLLGVSGNAFTRLGPPETTNASTVTASVNYTTKKQFNVLVRSNIFGRGQQVPARRATGATRTPRSPPMAWVPPCPRAIRTR